MKIALCLHGYFDSLTDLDSKGEDGFKHIEKNILKYRNEGHTVDVFCHSWEPHLESKIRELYNPTRMKVDAPETFQFERVVARVGFSKKDIDPNGLLGTKDLNSPGGTGYSPPERIFSHFYSIFEVLFLALFDDGSSTDYDWVIKSRYDLGRINRKTSGPGLNNPHPVQCIKFDPYQDNSKFYMANWNLLNEGPADMWFYSNWENMCYLGDLYPFTSAVYAQPGSDYRKAVVEGWPESKMNDFRSNESLKENPTKDLHKYPPHMVCNGILLYKWHLMQTGLWDKKVLLDGEWE